MSSVSHPAGHSCSGSFPQDSRQEPDQQRKLGTFPPGPALTAALPNQYRTSTSGLATDHIILGMPVTSVPPKRARVNRSRHSRLLPQECLLLSFHSMTWHSMCSTWIGFSQIKLVSHNTIKHHDIKFSLKSLSNSIQSSKLTYKMLCKKHRPQINGKKNKNGKS